MSGIGIGLTAIFGTAKAPDWFVDSVAGNDASSGKSPAGALETLGALLAKPIAAGQTLALKAGSHWREELDITSLSLNGIKVISYGSGNRPIIDASNILLNASFAKTGGQANVYEISITPDWAGGGDDSLNSFEDDSYLIYVADVATCDATAGSMTLSAEGAGTVTLYVHASDSSDVTANGKTYEYCHRQTAVDMISCTGGMLQGIEARRGLKTSYTAGVGNHSLVNNCKISQCTKNGLMSRQGTVIMNSTSVHGYNRLLEVTLFDSYDDDPEDEDVYYVDCDAVGLQANPTSGFGGHANPGVSYWGTLNFTRCTADDCLVGWNIKDTEKAIFTTCEYTGWANAACRAFRASSDVTASMTLTDCTTTMAGGRLLSDACGITITIENLTSVVTAAANTGLIVSDLATDLDLQNSEFTGVDLSGDTVVSFTHADAQIYARGNTYTNCWRVYYMHATGDVDSDYNIISEDATRFTVGGTGYTSAAAYVTGTGQDEHSTIL